jgi:hypothetical protein
LGALALVISVFNAVAKKEKPDSPQMEENSLQSVQ